MNIDVSHLGMLLFLPIYVTCLIYYLKINITNSIKNKDKNIITKKETEPPIWKSLYVPLIIWLVLVYIVMSSFIQDNAYKIEAFAYLVAFSVSWITSIVLMNIGTILIDVHLHKYVQKIKHRVLRFIIRYLLEFCVFFISFGATAVLHIVLGKIALAII